MRDMVDVSYLSYPPLSDMYYQKDRNSISTQGGEANEQILKIDK